MEFIKRVYLRVRGKRLYEIKLLGISLFLLTCTTGKNYNIFILYLPIFRIECYSNRFSINLLPFTWIFRCFTSWRLKKTENGWIIMFANKNLLESTEIKCYSFPSTSFNK